MRRKRLNKAMRPLWIGCSLLAGSYAEAQFYTFDPGNADEQGPPGIRYFGTAKDEAGAIVPGATMVLEGANASFIFVTDEQGRFKGNLPPTLIAQKVSAKCSKTGFTAVRVSKRPGPAGAKPTVQVDCLLRRASAG
jgi:hypothetical protein